MKTFTSSRSAQIATALALLVAPSPTSPLAALNVPEAHPATPTITLLTRAASNQRGIALPPPEQLKKGFAEDLSIADETALAIYQAVYFGGDLRAAFRISMNNLRDDLSNPVLIASVMWAAREMDKRNMTITGTESQAKRTLLADAHAALSREIGRTEADERLKALRERFTPRTEVATNDERPPIRSGWNQTGYIRCS